MPASTLQELLLLQLLLLLVLPVRTGPLPGASAG
jgi:hypothetical protein